MHIINVSWLAMSDIRPAHSSRKSELKTVRRGNTDQLLASMLGYKPGSPNNIFGTISRARDQSKGHLASGDGEI